MGEGGPFPRGLTRSRAFKWVVLRFKRMRYFSTLGGFSSLSPYSAAAPDGDLGSSNATSTSTSTARRRLDRPALSGAIGSGLSARLAQALCVLVVVSEIGRRDRQGLAAHARAQFDPLVGEIAADGRELAPVLA